MTPRLASLLRFLSTAAVCLALAASADAAQGHGKGKKGHGGGGGKPRPEAPAKPGAAGTPGAPGKGPDKASVRKPGDPARAELPVPAELERGSYPTLYPPANDLRVELSFAHQDATGGCQQSCLGVAGVPAADGGGFAAVFQDERKGNLGLFLARLDTDGERLGEQLPLSDQVGTARELYPAVAAGPGGAGAFVWAKMSGRSQAYLRFYDLARDGWSEMLPLGSQDYQKLVARETSQGAGSRAARGPDAMAERAAPSMADVVRTDDGRVLATWREGAKIHLQAYRDGTPVPPILAVNGDQADATGRPRLAADELGNALVAWETAKGIAMRLARAEPRIEADGPEADGPEAGVRLAPGGAGRLLVARPDPLGGFWLLAQDEERLVLRHVDADGARDGEDVPAGLGSFRSVDLATWVYGVVLLLERGEGATQRSIELRFLTADGRRRVTEPIRFDASPRSRGAFLAGEGTLPERLLVVWNDDREKNGDVFHAFLERGPDDLEVGPDARWNDDEASSYQAHASLASNGDRAILAWDDERASAGHVYCRRIDAQGGWQGDEIAVDEGPTDRDRALLRPGTAINADGRFLVAWLESAGPRLPHRLRAQAFTAAGEAVGPPLDVDPGFDAPAQFAPAAVALGGNQGYVIAWIRAGVGPTARRIALSGEFVGEAWRVGDRVIPTAQNVELELLDPHRLVCVWDEVAGVKKRVLTGHLLGADARTVGGELQFAWSGSGGDLDAELCATGDGGFLMAWTARDGPPRDVFARFFGPDGEPTSLPLGISTIANEQDFSDVARLADGSFVVVWEDDLSGTDHAVGRRIAADRTTLGPVVMVDPKVGKHIEVRHAPRVAALGDGFVSAWNDHAASRGVDVVARRFGAAFDAGIATPPKPGLFDPPPEPPLDPPGDE